MGFFFGGLENIWLWHTPQYAAGANDNNVGDVRKKGKRNGGKERT